ncbi:MAG: exosortase/archaeosortase family protein [Planctomycetes bacterium]|nr:exosortase/archaeosortase family protein [Planctomycetota bacterium]MBL7106368.1 exosortase/archaeosortase family protein [Phycisphaerae bacterium]
MAEIISSSSDTAQKQSHESGSFGDWLGLGVHTWVKAGVVLVLLYFLFSHEISKIVVQWGDPSWSHGFLIPLFSLYFLNQHRGQILEDHKRGLFKSNYIGLVLLLFVIVFYPLNIASPALQYGYFNPLSVIACLGALVLFLGGWRLVKYSWLAVLFLIFAVPLPQRYYVAITMPMRIFAANVSTALLNLFNGIEATVNGVVIDVIYKGVHLEPALNVAEACSGMRLLMAFLALGVAMAYLHYRPLWQRLVLLASTVPIAILCNVVRVTVTGFIYVLWEPKYAQGIYHDMLGMLMLPLAFFIYGGIAWFMENIFIEEESLSKPAEEIIIRKKSS